ncbi:MAG TPA: hypothetical protein ENJ82_05395, partial [Bacteroidetes bacterium]|nr:hypothetical protein [Bacteroidota bacterium]
TWGQRNTVHLYAAENYRLMGAAFSQESSWKMRQFLKDGGTEGLFYSLIADAAKFLQAEGVCTRQAISEFLESREGGNYLIGSWGGILVDLGKQGHLCLGGYDPVAKAHLLYATHGWNPNLRAPGLDYAEANTLVMLEYFRNYGPASFKDFCHWRGVSQTIARPWLASLHAKLAVLPHKSGDLFLPETDFSAYQDWAATAADLPALLLYRFDPMVLAHKDKSWLVNLKDYKQVWRKAAHVEGVVLQYGETIGVWKFQRKGQRIRFLISYFRSRNKLKKRELKARLHHIAGYLGYAEWEFVEEKF